jgi:transcription elongation factor GreB
MFGSVLIDCCRRLLPFARERRTVNPNYITKGGARRLSDELGHLRTVERPRVVQEVSEAAAQGDRSENAEYIYGKKRLREIDRRMHFLTKRLERAELVGPPPTVTEKIFFGATIQLEDEDGAALAFTIVGEDETDGARGRISWRSPIGRALLGKTTGDAVVVRRPAGEIELTILAVRYELE